MGAITTQIIAWQGYRHKENGIIVFYDSDGFADLPIRVGTDPHYETGTYGHHSCSASPHRTKFVKNKVGYLFFMTKYSGQNIELKDKIIVTGYYKIGSVADIRALHQRQLQPNTCFAEKNCYALKASINKDGENEMFFASQDDVIVLDEKLMKVLGINKKITKAAKIELDEKKVDKLLKLFEGKENRVADYIALSCSKEQTKVA